MWLLRPAKKKNHDIFLSIAEPGHVLVVSDSCLLPSYSGKKHP